VGSYLGLIPVEESSGSKRRLGQVSKQGNSLVRWLLVEAAATASDMMRAGTGSMCGCR